MRNLFTRLISTFMLISMFGLVGMAQGWDYQLAPSDGYCSVASEGTKFTITFEDKTKVYPVKGGKISLNAKDGTQLYPIQFNWSGSALPAEPWVFTSSIAPLGTVTFNGNQVIIDFKTALVELENYYITVHPQSIRDGSNTLFAGLLGDSKTDPDPTCTNDSDYGWDFTIADKTKPVASTYKPVDEAKNVKTSGDTLKISFNVPMAWSSAYNDSILDLKDGDIAIYTSTDNPFGQFGGDIIHVKPTKIEFKDNYKRIELFFPPLPGNTEMYVRIKSGIFKKRQTCTSCNPEFLWEGLNGNGSPLLGVNRLWNFKTKDDKTPLVKVTATDICATTKVAQNTKFIIKLTEKIIYTNNSVPFNQLMVGDIANDFVFYDGGDFEAEVISVPSGSGPDSLYIQVTPDDSLTSGKKYKVGLKQGAPAGKANLWDASLNQLANTTVEFTAGDFLAPVLSKLEANAEDGTTFQILANADEPGTVYYIVVEKNGAYNGGNYPPTMQQLYELAQDWDNDGNPMLPQGFPFNDINFPLDDYMFNDGDTSVTVNIWAAGHFNINSANTDVLERVFDLPRTNGTEYEVIAYVIDNSGCGPYNQDLGEDDGDYTPDAGWITEELTFDATTLDALPPVPSFDAARIDGDETCLTRNGPQTPILRDGPIYIKFNEPVKLTDGNIASGADIAEAFIIEVREGTSGPYTVVAISNASYYNAADSTIVLIPEVSFPSQYKVHVLMPINTVEDLAGNERNLAAEFYFCVENYCEPFISWTADTVDFPNSTSIIEDALLEPCNSEVAKDATVRVVLDMPVYTEDGMLLSNSPANPATYVGNFVKIRESAVGCVEAESGNLIYAQGNLVDFNITVENSDTATVIVIKPNNFVYKSEYFYNVEVEGSLQSYSGYSILDSLCYQNSNSISFQITDHQAPSITFFEAADKNPTNKYVRDINNCVDCNNPTTQFGLDSIIGVSISEWVELGFDGFRVGAGDFFDLEPTEIIKDANALRRYFKITTCEGVNVPFDVVDFTTDATGDTAYMYLNPYYAGGIEIPNFEAGVTYTVEFISNANEAGYPEGALADEHGNLVPKAEGCFTGYEEVEELSCAAVVTVGPEICGGVLAENGTLKIQVKFESPMKPVDFNQLGVGNCTISLPANVIPLLGGYVGRTTGQGGAWSPTVNCASGCTSNWVNEPGGAAPVSSPFTMNMPFIGPVTFHRILASRLEDNDVSTNCGPIVEPGVVSIWTADGDSICGIDVDQLTSDVTGTTWTWQPICSLVEGEDYVVKVSNGSWKLAYGANNCTYPEGTPQVSDELLTFTAGDVTAPVITTTVTPYSTSLSKEFDNIVLTFTEGIVPVDGQVMQFFESITNTLVATVNMSQIADTLIVGNVMTIPNNLFSTNLVYDKSYYVQFNAGLVTDSCYNALPTNYLTKTSFTFTVGANPPPNFLECSQIGTGFTPEDDSEIMDYTPTFKIKFTEPVVPVAGKKIDIYEETLPNSAVANFGNFYVTSMTANAAKTEYTITFANITKLQSALVYGKCYYLNIEIGAFKEVGGTLTTDRIVSFSTDNTLSPTACNWNFCVVDKTCPEVTFWPEQDYENVPVNADLFVQFSEPVEFTNGMALNTVTGQNFFSLTKGGNPVAFRIQQVAPDKTWVIIVPEDPDAPQLQTTDNVHMEDDMVYTLSVIPTANIPGAGTQSLVDGKGNVVGCDDDGNPNVTFRTEDITCPLFENGSVIIPIANVTETIKINSDGFEMIIDMPEIYGYGKVEYSVYKKGTAVTPPTTGLLASGTLVFDEESSLSDTIFVSGINANTANGYEYDVFLKFWDDEMQAFATNAQITAEWPYQVIPGLETIRIKDLNPAPNSCNWSKVTVKLCDDDAPIADVSEFKYNSTGATWVAALGAIVVPVDKNIRFITNEPVAFVATQPAVTPNQIALRDYENNLLVPAAITLATASGKTTITIDPSANLLDQHRYYLTWDRYALRDVAKNCGDSIFLAEKIDKSWWFKTADKTAPLVNCGTIVPQGPCIEKEQDIVVYVTDANDVNVNTALSPAFIDIYEVGEAIPHERIPLLSTRFTKEAVDTVDGIVTYKFTFKTVYEYLSGKSYKATIPAKLFKDPAGNESAQCLITWSVEDFEAPVASWAGIINYSYLYNVVFDDQYNWNWEFGIAGEELDDVPTNSFFAVNFNEDALVWNVEDSAWVSLWSTRFNPAILEDALTVTNEGVALEYGVDYQLVVNTPRSVSVFIVNDYSHIGYGTLPFNWQGSMKSNSQYQISVNEEMISDYPTCENEGNVMEDVLVLTLNTRDDNPPQLTVKDANGAVMCDASCPKADMNFVNMMQPGQDPDDFSWTMWPPYIPVNNLDSCGNICVAENDHITLQFNKPVVKTPTELLNRPWLWWEEGGINWWTEANLGIKPVDLTGDSRFVKISKWNGNGWVIVNIIDSAAVSADNTTFDLYWSGDLESEGVYKVTVAPYVLKDQIRVPDGNEFLGMTCVFKVKDHINPEVAKFMYSDNECDRYFEGQGYPMDLDTDTDLSILFTEPVKAGAGKLIIRRENGQQQQIIDASQITIDEDNARIVHINNGDFEENTLYYVEIQEGFVVDTAVCGSNAYMGIDPEDSAPGWQDNIPNFEWVFSTGDGTPPEPVSLYPLNQNDVSKQTDLVIVFDENVETGCEPYDPDCDPFELSISDYGQQGFYIYANNGANPSVDFGNFVEFIPWNSPRVEITGTDIYNGLVNNKVTIDPVTEFQRNVTYYVRVSGGLYCDGFSNKWAGVRNNSWFFTITNDVEPVISYTVPAMFGAPGSVGTVPAQDKGYVVTDLVMVFVDEVDSLPINVAKGSGVLRIYEYIYQPATLSYYEKLYKTIDINDPSVVIAGNVVTVKNVTLRDDINPDNCLAPRMYYVTVSSGAITNGYPGSLTYWAGFNDAFDWRFYTGPDSTFVKPHTIVQPLGVNLTVPAASTLKISFAENIEAIPGTTGKVKIFKVGTGQMVQSFTVMNSNISGNMLTLTSNAIVDETKYYVTIDAGAFGDTSTCSTPFYGLTDTTAWTFETGDNTKPVPVWAADLKQCENPCVTVKFTTNESKGIIAGTGTIKLWKNGIVYASKNATIGADGNSFSAEFCGLPDTTVFVISVDEGTIIDKGTNSLPNAAITNVAWTFKTGDNTAPVVAGVGPTGASNEASVVVEVKATEKVTPVVGKKVIVSKGATSDMYDVSTMVSTDGMTYKLNVANLTDATVYTVTVEAGAFKDLACEANPTAEATVWSFTTDDNTAPAIIATKPDNNAALTTYIGMPLEFTFSEMVAKGTGTITITRGADVLAIPVSSSDVTIDGIVVKVALTDKRYFGLVNVSVSAGAFVDKAINPNGNVAKAWSFSIVDNSMANDCLLSKTPKDGDNCVDGEVYLTMEFCERVDNGSADKKLKIYSVLEVQGGLGENKLFKEYAITDQMINGKIVTVLVQGLADTTSYIVLLDKGAITDENGNEFIGISDPTVWNFTTGDNTAPIVVLIPAGATNRTNKFDVYADFSELVKGSGTNGAIVKTDFIVTNAIDYSIMQDATDKTIYKISIEAADMAVVTVTVPVTITDVNCNFNPLANAVTGTYTVGDNKAPTVKVTSAPADAMNTPRMFDVVLTFSEKVKGVISATATSIGLTGVTTTDSIVYTLKFAGADEATGKLVLDKTKVTDVSQNANVLVDGLVWDYMVGDFIVPTAVVAPATNANVNTPTQVVTVTFSEGVIVPVGGVVFTGGTAAAPVIDGNKYTYTITAVDLAVVKMDLTSKITDDSKNANKLAPATYTYTFGDRTAPTVTVFKPSAKDTLASFDVTITFSEPVTGVSATSVTLSGAGAKPLVLRTLVDGLAYEATIGGADKSTLLLNFSNAIKDVAGNALVPVTFTYTIGDHTAPTLVATPDKGTFASNMFEVELAFNEDVTGVASGIIVTNGTYKLTGSGKSYVVAITGESMSTVMLYVTQSVKDLAGNAFAGKSFTYKVNGLVPIATVQGMASSSAHVGTALQVKGTVTAVAAAEGFFVQDASAAWSGIWVEYSDVAAIKIGDGVIVTGEVAEQAAVTTIIASSVAAATGTPAITPIKVTPTDAKAEKYESVLVKVEGARADEANTVGEWNIYLQVTDNVLVNDWMYAYKPVKGQFYHVTGVVNARLDAFRIEPRMASDIVDLKATPIAPEAKIDFKVYPNPFNDHIVIDNNDILTRVVVVNIAGQRVIDIEYPNREIRTANLVSGVYVISLFTEDGIVKSERMIKR